MFIVVLNTDLGKPLHKWKFLLCKPLI